MTLNTREEGALSASETAGFRARIEALCGEPVRLRVNDNASTLISCVRPKDGSPVRLSVHRAFVRGGPKIESALAQYISRPTPASNRALRQFINANAGCIHAEPARRRRVNLRSRGAVYDLHELGAAVNAQFFEGRLDVRITWGRGRIPNHRARRRHVTFGSYDHRQHVIRIHPALDSPDVPEFFLRFLLYHEMLHAALDPEHDADGRRRLHSPRFRQLERSHPDYDRAIAWEREFVRKL